jgi:predicted cobalt transporter CbtA
MNMPKVKTVRTKKRSALLKPSALLEVASHAAMGVAMGLALAFVLTHIPMLGVATLINHSAAPDTTRLVFVCACVTMSGIGAALTGLLFMMTEDN